MTILTVKNATEMAVYVAKPKGEGPFPAMMVFQEAFGVNDHIKSIADRLADEGYIAIAPELFHRTAPAGFEAPYSDFQAVATHIGALTPEFILNDIQATYDWLTTQNDVIKDKIGCIGFCLGGRAAFLANSQVQLSAAVSFYGGGTHTLTDRATSLSAPHLFFWGGKDTHIKPEHIQAVTDSVKNAGKEYINVAISYADHGFFCDARPAYHPQAAKEAWGMTKEFLKNKLS